MWIMDDNDTATMMISLMEWLRVVVVCHCCFFLSVSCELLRIIVFILKLVTISQQCRPTNICYTIISINYNRLRWQQVLIPRLQLNKTYIVRKIDSLLHTN